MHCIGKTRRTTDQSGYTFRTTDQVEHVLKCFRSVFRFQIPAGDAAIHQDNIIESSNGSKDMGNVPSHVLGTAI